MALQEIKESKNERVKIANQAHRNRHADSMERIVTIGSGNLGLVDLNDCQLWRCGFLEGGTHKNIAKCKGKKKFDLRKI